MEEWRVKIFETDSFSNPVEIKLADWLNDISKEIIDPDFFFLEKLITMPDDKLMAVVSITKHTKPPEQQGRLDL
jgi:hypothetical protein